MVALGNAQFGIEIASGAVGNTIGGTTASAGNLITQNGGLGVEVLNDLSIGDQITANRIYANKGQAIALRGDGVTRNSSTLRQGPDHLQDFPILLTAEGGQVEGFLWGSVPDTTFLIDVFASAGYGPGGAGEAEAYLGSLQVTTDSQGQVV